MPLLFSEYSSNNFQQCFTREGLVEVVGSTLLHRGSPNFGILNGDDESKPNLQITRLCPAGTASIPPRWAREGWTETTLIRVPIRSKSIAALPSAGSRPSKPPEQSIGTTMSRTGFLSSTRRMRGRVRGWILALTAEKAIALVSIGCSFRDIACLPLMLLQPWPKRTHVYRLHPPLRLCLNRRCSAGFGVHNLLCGPSVPGTAARVANIDRKWRTRPQIFLVS